VFWSQISLDVMCMSGYNN